MSAAAWDYVRGGAKAALAGAITGVSTGAALAADGQITSGEWWAIAAAALVAVGGVYGVRNTGPKAPQ